MSEEKDPKPADLMWEEARRKMTMVAFYFMTGVSAFILLFGLVSIDGVSRLNEMKDYIYTIGGIYALIVTGYLGLDMVSRFGGIKMPGKKKDKKADAATGE